MAVSLVRFVYMLMKHLLLPAQLQVKLILLTTNLIVMTNAWFIFIPVTVVKNNTWVKLLANSVLDETIIKLIVGNINVVKRVWNNTYMSIFAAATIIVL